MISDSAKIFLLFGILAICGGSLFTSSSFYTIGYNNGLSTLEPSIELCETPKRIASDCLAIRRSSKSSDNSESGDEQTQSLEDSSSSCASKLSQVTKCERTAAKAYKAINMGGCLTYIQAASICKDEWCRDNNNKACKRECSAANKALDKCVKKNVDQYFHSAGLNADGTTMMKK